MKIITAEQFEDLPEGTTVIVPVMGGNCRMTWQGGKLHGDLHIDRRPEDPQWVLDHYGPLNVPQDR